MLSRDNIAAPVSHTVTHTRCFRDAGGKRIGDSKWCMPGFSVDPGGATLVAGRYIVKSVQSQVVLQGPVGREIWLGVDLRRGRRRAKITGWMQSGELQRRAAGDGDWLARLGGRAGKAGVWRATTGHATTQ